MAISDAKSKVLNTFRMFDPADLSVSEAAQRSKVSPNTASTYIKVLVAEGVLEQSRTIGNAKLFRLKRE